MKTVIKLFLVLSIFCSVSILGQTFDVQFVTSVNDGTNLKLDVQVRGNSLPATNTLNSVTFDISFSDALAAVPGLLTYTGATDWAFQLIPDGYTVTTATRTRDNNIRITIVGGAVGTLPGYNIGSTFATWVSLNFTHTSPSSSASFTVAPGTAAISLFNTLGNSDMTGNNTEYNPPDVILNDSNVDPLPVELSSFKVNSVEGTKAQLNWETATEINNYGFEIERSVVVEETEEEAVWEKVAFVEGHGNSNSTKVYSFTDKNIVGGSKFLYRLKQIDIDGTFEYTDAVEVEVLPTKYELFQNYPNPFNPTTNIKFSLPEDTKLAINIYNLLGEKVATILNEELKAGFHQVDFNTYSAGYTLASGVYIYTIESKNFTQVKKMILMK